MKTYINHSIKLLVLMLLINTIQVSAQVILNSKLVDFDTLVVAEPIYNNDSIVNDTNLHVVLVPNNGNTPVSAALLDTSNRLVFFIHGLGGSIGSWSKAKQAVEAGVIAKSFPSYKIIGEEPLLNNNVSYGSTSMLDAGMNLIESTHKAFVKVKGILPGAEEEFIIAHSQGGIVSRTADYYINNFGGTYTYKRAFKGIVTFGTPHLGARIINNINPLKTFLTKGSSDLSDGPLREKVATSSFSILFNKHLQDVIDNIIPKVSKTLIDHAFSDFTTKITEDFKEGAPHLWNKLTPNDAVTTTHKAAMYGVEQEPVLWRTMSWFVSEQPNNLAEFEANTDTAMVNTINRTINHYLTKSVYYLNASNKLGWLNFIGPIGTFMDLVKRKQAKRISEGYSNGVYWLANANEFFKIQTGATEYTPIQNCAKFCKLVPKSFFSWIGFPTVPLPLTFLPNDGVNCASYFSFASVSSVYNQICVAMPNINFIITNKENDGIVTAASASGYPNMSYPPYRMMGSNHQQMRNDDNTRKALYELLERKLPSYTKILDGWFETDHK